MLKIADLKVGDILLLSFEDCIYEGKILSVGVGNCSDRIKINFYKSSNYPSFDCIEVWSEKDACWKNFSTKRKHDEQLICKNKK